MAPVSKKTTQPREREREREKEREKERERERERERDREREKEREEICRRRKMERGGGGKGGREERRKEVIKKRENKYFFFSFIPFCIAVLPFFLCFLVHTFPSLTSSISLHLYLPSLPSHLIKAATVSEMAEETVKQQLLGAGEAGRGSGLPKYLFKMKERRGRGMDIVERKREKEEEEGEKERRNDTCIAKNKIKINDHKVQVE